MAANIQGVKAAGESASNPIISRWNTYLFCMMAPNPVGVGQPVLVSVQLDKTSPTATAFNRGDLFDGFTLTITKPDNQIETKTLPKSWPTSGTYIQYAPTMTGEYKLQAHFAGQWINGSYTSKSAMFSVTWANYTFGPPPYTYIYEDLYCAPSDSEIITLTVQEQPVTTIPNNPLPTGYWTVPVNAENKGWNMVADNWLMPSYDKPSRAFTAGNAFAPYTSAPDSAHVLWNKPIEFGGIAGGPLGDRSYYTGLSYEQFYTPLIIQGQIIYQDHGPSTATAYGSRCLDLYTGKQLWYLNNTSISFAQVLEFDSPNEHGALPYLWSTGSGGGFYVVQSTTWLMYDAFSANDGEVPRLVCSVANVTTGTTRFGPNGELLNFAFSGAGANQRLVCWNSTKAIYRAVGIDTWGPSGTIDGRVGIEFNVSAPAPVSGTMGISDINVKEGYILASLTDSNPYPRVMVDAGYKIPTQSSGAYPATISALWTQNRTDIESTTTFTTFVQDGIYARFQGSLLTLYCYDMKTGNEMWKTGPITTNGWAYFSYLCANAYGKIYLSGYDGHVRAFNVADGSLAWDYYFGDAGYENAYGTWPTYNGFSIADGKLFICADEHSSDPVLWRGGKTYAIDCATGANVWNMSGWLRNTAISDGYLTSYNCLDGQVYVIGKGTSATTVSAPQAAVVKGVPIMITGTVTDQSPGQPDTPAISDADMPAWMEYLHMQKPMPTNAIGISVKITAYDPNGNFQTIGTTMSDDSGTFGLAYTPELEGSYQIRATFEGTNSYGGSYATAYIVVGPATAAPVATATPTAAPTATPTATPTVAPTVSPSPAPTPPGIGLGTEYYIAIAAAVIIIAVAAVAVVLRKRK